MKYQTKLLEEEQALREQFDEYKNLGLKLDMSRGKPCPEQLDLSKDILSIVSNQNAYLVKSKVDCRNYGLLDGIPEMKKILAPLFGVQEKNVMVGGNSSLGVIFDTISCFMTHGVCEQKPWKTGKVKFLCPVPGYDRHFTILQYFNIEPICIPLNEAGPDMNMVEKLISEDPSIKGIFCIPKYSNPTGITYQDETVKRLSKLHPAAKDFRIFWDNAYAVHDIREKGDTLLNIMDECIKNGNENFPIIFGSTSKITYPGAGVAAVAASEQNLKQMKKHWSARTIGFDKINQLRHALFFKNYDGIISHMKEHRKILEPKFDVTLKVLRENLDGIATWTSPNGGYFISVDVMTGCAKKVVAMCKEAGVVLTPAGATYPFGMDPHDSNIRLAPTYPPIDELKKSMEVFCVATKLCAIEKLRLEV